METVAARFQIVGEKILLRRFRRADVADVYHYAKDREASRYTYIPYPNTMDDSESFVRRTIAGYRTRKQITLAIELPSENRVIGGIGLHHIDYTRQSAEMGYVVGKDYWGRGFASEAVNLILKYSFEQLRFHRIYACVFHPNEASSRVLLKCGFQLEGRHRETLFRDGQWLDDLVYGMLVSDWKKRCPTH